jgi:hypothetical protein
MNGENLSSDPFDVVRGRPGTSGSLAGILVVLALLLMAAGYFFWNQHGGRDQGTAATTTEITIYRSAQAATSSPRAASSTGSAELESIENGLYGETENVSGLNF